MSSPTLTSERLVLRKFTRMDVEALHTILKDEEVNTFLPWFVHKTMEDTRVFLQERFLNYDDIPKSYRYAICLRKTFNAMLGEVSTFCGDKQGGVESYLIAAIRL